MFESLYDDDGDDSTELHDYYKSGLYDPGAKPLASARRGYKRFIVRDASDDGMRRLHVFIEDPLNYSGVGFLLNEDEMRDIARGIDAVLRDGS